MKKRLALLLLALATPADAATWVELRFTAPADSAGGGYVSGVGRYRVETLIGGAWDSVRIYRAPDPAAEGVPVQDSGSTVTLFVSQTVALHTSRTYRLASIDNRGNRSRASNLCVVATGFPDTLVGLSRPVRGGGFAFQRTFGAPVGWKLAPGDSGEVVALHQEVFQQAHRELLCRAFGYWSLRGAPMLCP